MATIEDKEKPMTTTTHTKLPNRNDAKSKLTAQLLLFFGNHEKVLAVALSKAELHLALQGAPHRDDA